MFYYIYLGSFAFGLSGKIGYHYMDDTGGIKLYQFIDLGKAE